MEEYVILGVSLFIIGGGFYLIYRWMAEGFEVLEEDITRIREKLLQFEKERE